MTNTVLKRRYEDDIDWDAFERHQLDGLNALFQPIKPKQKTITISSDTSEEIEESSLSGGIDLSPS